MPDHPLKEFQLNRAASEPATVTHLEAPPRFVNPNRIHPRRRLPLIREGMEREFHSTTLPLALFRTTPMALEDEITLLTNTALASPGEQDTASNVGEPSTAIHGQVVFYTGNWYAAVSSDAGHTFQFVDPATAFQPFDPPGSKFCCDQVVTYIPSIDTFVWLLQYGPDTGDNMQRLAFAKTEDVVNGKWRLYDITTERMGASGAFMDFPDLAVGANHLYVTTNVFGPGQQVGSAVIRIPIAGIESGPVTARPFLSTDFQSFRVAQNYGTTAYFAAHRDTSTLEVFCWPEDQEAPVGKAIGVARWIGGNGYQSRTPSGGRWLDRVDPRITGATLAGNQLYFAWSVDRGSNQRPKPFVQIARLDAANLTLLENINIFDTDSATAYGALATNADNEVGIAYMLGGETTFPTHVVGILTNARQNVTVASGDRGPLADTGTQNFEWGDYLTVRRAYPNQQLFAAAGYTMSGPGDGSNRDSTPRFVLFGRTKNTGNGESGAGLTPVPGTAPAPDPTTGPSVTKGARTAPFKDVNQLPIVSPAVAQKILAAAMQAGSVPMAQPAVALKFVTPEITTKPGVERWSVKTGQDGDVGNVAKNIIGGKSLGVGIVPATVEQLVRIPRPPDMSPPTSIFPAYQAKRRAPVELTVWQLEGNFIVLKLESDGDYHLVLQGSSGDTMIVEVPTPTKPFLGSSPWFDNIKTTREEVDRKLVSHLSPNDFVPLGEFLVPREAVPMAPEALPASLPQSFCTPPEGAESSMPTFKTAIKSTPARVTGVGFFDQVHGQTGVSQLNGMELHPVLKIEWL